MNKFFDKSKIYNYVIAGIFLVTAMIFIKNMSSFIWNFDITNRRQLITFLKNIVNGKAFLSGKQLSFLITFVGSVCVVVSGSMIAMQIKLSKSNDNTKPEESKSEEAEKTLSNSNENAVTSIIANAKTEEKNKVLEEAKPEEEKENERFAMYGNGQNPNNTVNKPNEIAIEPIEKNENLENSEIEEEERARLQAKIKEIMKKMKEKQEAEESSSENIAKPAEKVEEKPVNSEKLLSKVEFSKPLDAEKVEKIDMNFKNISEEENNVMEQIVISAGFKLLSEIRIGSTGIDYLGVAKDKIAIIQLDTTNGNWFASEDKVEGNQTPVWFSEEGNKISPVFRALQAKSDIERLLKDQVNLPIETIACLTNSSVVNYSEFEEKWNELGVKVVKLNESEYDDFGDVKTISDIYPAQSQEEISEPEMNKVISILEKAEIPE